MNKILHGDCLEVLKTLEDNSVDCIVTDPPYGLSFMGKKWDYDVPSEDIWKEAFRVLKPGGHLLSFAGTRTYHRMAVRIEDSGFEIRDMISWLYGSGFPKSLNIGKSIDKMKKTGNASWNGTGNSSGGALGYSKLQHNQGYRQTDYSNKHNVDYEISDDVAKQWDGWGTALKPACEPIVVARKPLSEKNVALNVLKHGTGGINIDECRIGTDELTPRNNKGAESILKMGFEGKPTTVNPHSLGRFPANIILDEEAGKILDEQSGACGGKWGKQGDKTNSLIPFTESQKGLNYLKESEKYVGDKGGASRFFYCAKASKSERNAGCEELKEKQSSGLPMRSKDGDRGGTGIDGTHTDRLTTSKNNHPTVKPIKLMEYLVKLVTPKGGVCLDPFIGSGTTAIACKRLGFKYIGIEREEDYIKIANARLSDVQVRL